MALVLRDTSRCGDTVCGLGILSYGQVQYEADGGAITGGSADSVITRLSFLTSGGAVTGGAADLALTYFAVIGSGGAVASGSADTAASYRVSDAGGSAATGGSAPAVPSFVLIASGGALTDGLSALLVSYLIADAGGQAITSGAASFAPAYTPTASGGVITAGAADAIPIFYATAAGGAISGGLSLQRVDYVPVIVPGHADTGGECYVVFLIDTKGLPIFLRTFDGDVRLSLSEDGGSITIWGGQPDMDGGLSTAVHISLFTDSGWWGNGISREGEDIGSDFEASLRSPLTNQARLDVEEAARQALRWLTDSGIAEAVEVSATIPAVNMLALAVRITEPAKAPTLFRYAVNWQNQHITMEAA
jgi:phage gp46-like protein